jgi:hypothetical protein
LPSEELRNHEHIALLGLCLSSPSSEAHKIARHLADYLLVWAGGGGKDDVGKSKHMARIANSVYPGHCNEEDCDLYGVFPDGKPSKMMEASLMLGSVLNRFCKHGMARLVTDQSRENTREFSPDCTAELISV